MFSLTRNRYNIICSLLCQLFYFFTNLRDFSHKNPSLKPYLYQKRLLLCPRRDPIKKKKAFIIAIAVIAGLGTMVGVFFILSALSILSFGLNRHSAVYYKAKRIGQTAIATVTPSSFTPVTCVQYGNHIYCPDDTLNNSTLSEAQKNDVLSYFPQIDRNLTCDVYVSYINSGDCSTYLGYDYAVILNQMADGAIIKDTMMKAYIQNGTVTITQDYSRPFLDTVPSYDPSTFVPMDDIFKTVEEHAKEHENEMFMGAKEPLKGKYTLYYGVTYEMDPPDYYYEFEINEYSHVGVIPYNGNILYEYYWNGVYVD